MAPPHGYILVTSFALSHSPYVSESAAFIIFIVGFAAPYEDYRVLFHTYVALFLAIFCQRTVMFL